MSDRVPEDFQVSFTEMKHGTRDDYLALHQLEQPFLNQTGERVLKELARQADETLAGYKINRLEHGLQSATRALNDGADIDWIVGALLHDIGDGLAPQNHDKMAAEVIRPFVRDEVAWTVEHHGVFQMVYYAEHYGWDPEQRQAFRDHPFYQSCVDFCERWDQSSFDPDYPMHDLDFFAPMVREVFARKAYDEAHVMPGVVVGVPGGAQRA